MSDRNKEMQEELKHNRVHMWKNLNISFKINLL